MSDTLIKVEGVSKKFCRSLKRSLWYGMQDLGNELIGRRHGGDGELRPEEFWAVKDVSFKVKRGECLGLIGRNGAGKTTLLRMLNGLIKPDSGRLEMRGRVGALIALGAGFNPVLSGRENIYVNSAILGLHRNEVEARIDQIIDFSGISDFIDMPVQSYSSGMAVRLGFAIAIHTEPDILLLDEVLAVGDMDFQARCFNALAELRTRGTAFIIVSHNMHHIERYADRALLLNRGTVAHLGETRQGIAEYLHNDENAPPTHTPPDWSLQTGSGKLHFAGARFLDANGEEITQIDAGQGVTLELDVFTSDDFNGSTLIDLSIRSPNGTMFRTTTKRDGVYPNIQGPRSLVRLQFPTIPAIAGPLNISVAALDPSTSEVFDWKQNISLHVHAPKIQHGQLELPVRWEFAQSPQERA